MKVFQTLKIAFTIAPVLAYYNYIKKIIIKTDALNQALGGVFYQTGENSKLKPVAFFFTKYFTLKYNYKIYNKKLLVIVKALKNGALNYKKLSNYLKLL